MRIQLTYSAETFHPLMDRMDELLQESITEDNIYGFIKLLTIKQDVNDEADSIKETKQEESWFPTEGKGENRGNVEVLY
jgi:hypothetical protein